MSAFVAAFALSALASAPAAPQRTEYAAVVAEHRASALALDLAQLPRAEPERWREFDPAKLDPGNVPRAYGFALEALQESDLPLALFHLQAVLRELPDFPPAWHQAGVVYFRLQRYGDAWKAFTRFLEAAPARVGETRGLAHALHSLGRYAEARAHYERVLAAAPADVEARRGLAVALLRLGEPEAARAQLERVLAAEPKHAEAWTWMAEACSDLERHEDALHAAERARDLAPYAPRGWFALAQAASALGREEEAHAARERFRLLSRADQAMRRLDAELELDPRDLERRRALIELARSVGDVQSARRNLALFVRARPEDVWVRIYALDVLDALGDGEGARLAALELERVGAQSADAWRRLEAWFARTGDRQRQLQAGERWRRLGG